MELGNSRAYLTSRRDEAVRVVCELIVHIMTEVSATAWFTESIADPPSCPRHLFSS
jgi:hypothetical protein